MMMTSGQAVKYKGSIDCTIQILRKEGAMSLMKGAGKLCILCIIILSVYADWLLVSLFLVESFSTLCCNTTSAWGSIVFFNACTCLHWYLIAFYFTGANVLRGIAGAGVLSGFDKFKEVYYNYRVANA